MTNTHINIDILSQKTKPRNSKIFFKYNIIIYNITVQYISYNIHKPTIHLPWNKIKHSSLTKTTNSWEKIPCIANTILETNMWPESQKMDAKDFPLKKKWGHYPSPPPPPK